MHIKTFENNEYLVFEDYIFNMLDIEMIEKRKDWKHERKVKIFLSSREEPIDIYGDEAEEMWNDFQNRFNDL